VIKSDFEEAGHEDVLRKVTADLGDKSDADTVRAQRAECLAQAKEELMGEG
jgi:hypothetical protein